MFTGSQDRTIKMWDLSSLSVVDEANEPQHCKSLTTQKVHDKDINSLDIAPNDILLASGSQDRMEIGDPILSDFDRLNLPLPRTGA